MTELMEKMLKAVELLSPRQQNVIARDVLAIIDNQRPPVDVPKEHKAAIDEAAQQIKGGETISQEDMKAVYATYRK